MVRCFAFWVGCIAYLALLVCGCFGFDSGYGHVVQGFGFVGCGFWVLFVGCWFSGLWVGWLWMSSVVLFVVGFELVVWIDG